MTRNQKFGIVGAALVVSFAAGRYSVPTSVKTETKTVDTNKEILHDQKTESRKRKKKTVVTETTLPNGEKKKETVITDVSDHESHVNDKDTAALAQTTSSLNSTNRVSAPFNLSLLGGLQLSTATPVFGLAFSRTLVGPFTIGAFGLSNSTVGLSLGINF